MKHPRWLWLACWPMAIWIELNILWDYVTRGGREE